MIRDTKYDEQKTLKFRPAVEADKAFDKLLKHLRFPDLIMEDWNDEGGEGSNPFFAIEGSVTSEEPYDLNDLIDGHMVYNDVLAYGKRYYISLYPSKLYKIKYNFNRKNLVTSLTYTIYNPDQASRLKTNSVAKEFVVERTSVPYDKFYTLLHITDIDGQSTVEYLYMVFLLFKNNMPMKEKESLFKRLDHTVLTEHDGGDFDGTSNEERRVYFTKEYGGQFKEMEYTLPKILLETQERVVLSPSDRIIIDALSVRFKDVQVQKK